jgi:phospholipase C
METDMKVASKIPLLLFTLGATLAAAQISQGTFKHIIIVVQENRTPDNLFGAGAGSITGGHWLIPASARRNLRIA